MSGVTPILDTLLHQVLGRRDAPVQRAVSERPIAPTQAGRGAGTLYSDSRLDPRVPGDMRHGAIGDKLASGPSAKSASGYRAPALEQSVAATRLSAAAKTIADILSLHRAPLSSVHAGSPANAMPGHVEPAALAGWLRQSIQTSGLFYEAHLLRWYQGRLPRSLLLLEPQMRHVARHSGRKSTAADGAGPRDSPSPHRGPSTQGNAAHGMPGVSYGSRGQPLPLSTRTGLDAASLPSAQPPGHETHHGEVVRSGLEPIVRHQLEMMASPVLRWEGSPMSGMFLTWILEPPGDEPHGHARDDEADRTPSAEQAWRSRLRVVVRRLGELQLDVRVHPRRVDVDMLVPAPAIRPLRVCTDHLRQRLAALGFEQVQLRIEELRIKEGGGDDGK